MIIFFGQQGIIKLSSFKCITPTCYVASCVIVPGKNAQVQANSSVCVSVVCRMYVCVSVRLLFCFLFSIEHRSAILSEVPKGTDASIASDGWLRVR